MKGDGGRDDASALERGRLRQLCRRGMKELDVLFERYLAQHFAGAPAAEREAFIELLSREDPDLWAWILGAPAPQEFANVLERLRQHR